MDISNDRYDVAILGAGPAGLIAAIRLADLGYRIALIEEKKFPREQIGESLSPGIYNIFSYLRLEHLLDEVPCKTVQEMYTHWEEHRPGIHFEKNIKRHDIIDRAILDQHLLREVVRRGGHLAMPAKILRTFYNDTDWFITYASNDKTQTCHCRVVLDARGRKGCSANEALTTAAPSVGIWTDTAMHSPLDEIFVEAVPAGWLWGTPLANGFFRTMFFTDPELLKQQRPDQIFKQAIGAAEYFQKIYQPCSTPRIVTCSVTSYVNKNYWNNNFIKIGDAAFAIDPLSTTGVEKAMRFSLQVAIAVNTFLAGERSDIAQAYYREKISESVLQHTRWTSEFYHTAWPDDTHTFWKNKRTFNQDALQHFIVATLGKPADKYVLKEGRPKYAGFIDVDSVCDRLAHKSIYLSTFVETEETLCVIGNFAVRKHAISHPNLPGKMAFLEGIEIIPLLTCVIPGSRFRELTLLWSAKVPYDIAKRLAVFLWNYDILVEDV